MDAHAMGKDELAESTGQVTAVIHRLDGTVNNDVFWQFVRGFKHTAVGYENATVMREAKKMIALVSNAIFLYGLFSADMEVIGEEPADDEGEVYKAVMTAERKILWMNRQCHALTNRYFFTGRLRRNEKSSFCFKDAYALCYEMYVVVVL